MSRDSLASHKRFADKLSLPYSLLVDETGYLHQAFDVLKEKKLFGKVGLGTERSTFVLNGQGILINEFRKVKASGHAQDVLDYLIENAKKK